MNSQATIALTAAPTHDVDMAHVRELDLNSFGHDTIADKINAVPGLKTSAAFFTFLRANLVVNPSAMSSSATTPMLEPASSQTLPPPSPSPLSATPDTDAAHAPPLPRDGDLYAGLPPLEIGALTSRDDRLDALKLVADSIAQQRQSSSLHLVFHPYMLAALLAVLAFVFNTTWLQRRDLGLALMLHCSVVMTYLMIIRLMTGRYLTLAEDLKWDWAVAEDGEEDTFVGVRFGPDLIGALVLRLEPNPAAGKRKNRVYALKGGKGVIRAWTVALRYRDQGVGSDLLHEAVRITREKCGKDAEVGFALEHANSARVLPDIFNGPLKKGEQRAAKALEGVIADNGRRRR